MTERVRALLDGAVAGLEPSDPDPVAGVVARGRAGQRRRIVGAAMAAVVVLVGGGVVVSSQLGGQPPTTTVGDGGRPPTPKLVGDTVVAGDLVLPVPKGWRVVPVSNRQPCGELENTILIGGPDQHGCQYGSVEVRGTANLFPSGFLVGPLDGTEPIITAPVTYTLRGGGPAWLVAPVDSELNTPGTRAPGASYYNVLLAPWSKVQITFRVPGPEQQQIIDTIRTGPPRRAGGLELPGTVDSATLQRPDADGVPRRAGFGKIKDPVKIAAMLELLRLRTEPVDNAHACAKPGQRTARLTLNAIELVTTAPTDGRSQPPSKPPSADPSPPQLDPPAPTIIISLGGGCQEAVSADGGRVRLSDETLKELERLFGIAK